MARKVQDGTEDQPGLLATAGRGLWEVVLLFFDFFRRNGLLVLLLVVAGLAALINAYPSLLTSRTLVLAGFGMVVILMASIVIANYRGFVEKREAYRRARREFRGEGRGKDEE